MMEYTEIIKEEIERLLKNHPSDPALSRLLNFVEGLISEEQRPIMKNNAIVEKLNNLIDEMTEAEYLCMTDMKWVADRIREFAEDEARSLALERPTQRQEGKCPTCHGAIRTTERRPDGDSVCAFGHKHKTADFYKPTPPPQSLVEALEEMDKKYSKSLNGSVNDHGITMVLDSVKEILAKFKEAK